MLTGGCYCEAVRIEVDGELGGGVTCHCETCQRLHSSHSYNMQSTVDAIKVVKGKTTIYEDLKANSGKVIRRHFCGDCGSAIFSVPDAMPGVAFLKVGILDGAKHVKPVAEIYMEQALPHAPLNPAVHPELKQFEGFMAKEL